MKTDSAATISGSSAAPLGPLPVLPREFWATTNSEELHQRTRPDQYGYYPRARALADLVTKTPTPFTVGIFAEWGRGKSTFLETVALLATHNPPKDPKKKVRLLRYRPWLFRLETFEDVWLSLIEDIQGQLESQNAADWDSTARKTFLKTSTAARLLRASGNVL
jgi:hypothetical protein